MKITLTFLPVFLFSNYFFSQNVEVAACASPFQCTRDLRSTFFAASNIDSLDHSYANADSIPVNFHDVSFKNSKPSCNMAVICTKDTSQLRYRVYSPSPRAYNYNSCKLPVIFIFHGGGYRDCAGSNLSPDLLLQCRAFARRGFVAITCEYRLGVLLTESPNQDNYSVQQMLGIWRGGQDGRGGLRSVIRREIEGTEPYRIDTAKIFVSGNSAGALIAMNIAYYLTLR